MDPRPYTTKDLGDVILIIAPGIGPCFIRDKRSGKIYYAKSSSEVPPLDYES